MIALDEDALYASGRRYEDLVRAVDVVVTKPGYGIIAECIANDTALLYTSRGHFVEYDVLVAEMPRWLRCGFIAQDDLRAGRLTGRVVGYEIGNILDADAIVLNDGLSNGVFVHNYARRTQAGTAFKSGSSCGGWGVGAAFGAKMAKPGQDVVLGLDAAARDPRVKGLFLRVGSGDLSVPKAEELVATPYRHGGKERAEAFFLDGMTRAMHNLAEQAHPAFPVTLKIVRLWKP